MVADREVLKKPDREDPDVLAIVVAIYGPLAGIIYMSTWLFWAGFIKLSGDL